MLSNTTPFDGPVLVTGAAGFIGSHLSRALVHRGVEVHALVRASTSRARLADIENAISIHTVDLRNAAELEQTVRRAAPRRIFHLAIHRAARNTVSRAEQVQSNLVGTWNLIEAAAGCPTARLIHAGSHLEYGSEESPRREAQPAEPTTLYGALKACSTLLVRHGCDHAGLEWVVLRLFSVYGPAEPEYRLIPTTIRAALNGEVVPLTPTGTRRDHVYVEDVVDALLRAAALPAAVRQIINIGSGTQTDNTAVVDAVERLSGLPIRRNVGAYPPHDTDRQHQVADISKAESLLGWRPAHSLDEGLTHTIDWLRGQPRLPAPVRGASCA